MQQQRTQHIAAHNTSTTISIITITITAPLIINHGDPKYYTPVTLFECYFCYVLLLFVLHDSLSSLSHRRWHHIRVTTNKS
jgi:hypothetical protein